MFNYWGWLESSRTNILRLRLNVQRSVSWAQAHDCISLGVNFTHENIRTGYILWGRGLNLHLSGCNPHPHPFSWQTENGNDPLLHRFRINEGLRYHNKVKRKWRNYQSIWGPKLEKEILFYKSLKCLLTCISREQMSKEGFVCVCVCLCFCVCVSVCVCVCVCVNHNPWAGSLPRVLGFALSWFFSFPEQKVDFKSRNQLAFGEVVVPTAIDWIFICNNNRNPLETF